MKKWGQQWVFKASLAVESFFQTNSDKLDVWIRGTLVKFWMGSDSPPPPNHSLSWTVTEEFLCYRLLLMNHQSLNQGKINFCQSFFLNHYPKVQNTLVTNCHPCPSWFSSSLDCFYFPGRPRLKNIYLAYMKCWLYAEDQKVLIYFMTSYNTLGSLWFQ